MPGRRPIKKGSFGAHFDEVVKHFPHAPLPIRQQRSNEEARAQQEKRDIHALLFERAWQLDRDHQDEGAPSARFAFARSFAIVEGEDGAIVDELGALRRSSLRNT